MLITKFSPEEKVHHLLTWAAEWNGGRTGRSMWSYSLSLGGSHALLNGWVKNRKLMARLTPEQQSLVGAARRNAADHGRQVYPG
jgi:hypothetical protein